MKMNTQMTFRPSHLRVKKIEIENRVMISAPSMRLQENIEKADPPIIETGAGVGVSNIQSQKCTITKGRCTKHDI